MDLSVHFLKVLLYFSPKKNISHWVIDRFLSTIGVMIGYWYTLLLRYSKVAKSSPTLSTFEASVDAMAENNNKKHTPRGRRVRVECCGCVCLKKILRSINLCLWVCVCVCVLKTCIVVWSVIQSCFIIFPTVCSKHFYIIWSRIQFCFGMSLYLCTFRSWAKFWIFLFTEKRHWEMVRMFVQNRCGSKHPWRFGVCLITKIMMPWWCMRHLRDSYWCRRKWSFRPHPTLKQSEPNVPSTERGWKNCCLFSFREATSIYPS